MFDADDVAVVVVGFFRTIAFNSINVRQMQKVNQNELRSVSADICVFRNNLHSGMSRKFFYDW